MYFLPNFLNGNILQNHSTVSQPGHGRCLSHDTEQDLSCLPLPETDRFNRFSGEISTSFSTGSDT